MLEADFVERASDHGPSLGQRFALRLRRRLPSGGPVITRPSGIVAGHSPHAGGWVGMTVEAFLARAPWCDYGQPASTSSIGLAIVFP